MTGLLWVKESGMLTSPIALTNTHSVGVVRDAVIQYRVKSGKADASGYYWSLPVVGETWDGWLNDTNGFHVKPEHAFEAMDTAAAGPVREGSVGGGTGMICYEFKGGIGTSSRKLAASAGGYTLGVIVQCNCGLRPQLTIAGVPVGKEIRDGAFRQDEYGSILIVVATDAPLLPHQLERLARRAALGLARTGSVSGNGSGDLFLAFSTANPGAASSTGAQGAGTVALRMLPNEKMNPLFEATAQATEEAIVNALVAAETMTGADGMTALGLPQDLLVEILRKYGRLPASPKPPASSPGPAHARP
jgi:L-aminopeptidase/D-esterase-like protein